MSTWHNFQDGTSHCDECPGQEAPYPLSGIGDMHADVMLVGQEPAYNVDSDIVDTEMDWYNAMNTMIQNRRDSMNPLWKHMMNIALAVQCSPTELYFTNLAKCAVDSASYEDCLEHCRGYFPREIAQVDPRVLLLHGSKVINVVFEMFDIEWSGTVGDVHGETFETSSLTLLPLYHWEYAYRQGTVDEYNTETASAVKEAL